MAKCTVRKRYLVGASFASGKYTLKELAVKYGISEASVSNIITQKIRNSKNENTNTNA